jgi:hypothetical protein
MKVGDLVRFRGNTGHGDQAYLVVSIDTGRGMCGTLEYAGLLGTSAAPGHVPLIHQQFPTYRLMVVHPGRPAVE